MASDAVVLDSSALICVFHKEPGYERIEARLEAANELLVGSPTVLEILMVLSRKSSDPDRLLQKALETYGVIQVSFTEAHCREASRAFQRFGKGRHPAGLNYGDCMAYAVAKVAGMPLLFVGADFSKTDIPAA